MRAIGDSIYFLTRGCPDLEKASGSHRALGSSVGRAPKTPEPTFAPQRTDGTGLPLITGMPRVRVPSQRNRQGRSHRVILKMIPETITCPPFVPGKIERAEVLGLSLSIPIHDHLSLDNGQGGSA